MTSITRKFLTLAFALAGACGGAAAQESQYADGIYRGFYYAPDDAPVPFQNCGLPLTEGEDREWTWTDGTDNRGVTRRIAPRWFYYEAWF